MALGELGKRLQLMAASAFWSIPALETQVLPNRKTWKLIPPLPSIETLKMINIVAQNPGFLAKQTIFEIDGQPVCTPAMQHASRVSAFPEQFPNVEKLQACRAWPKPQRPGHSFHFYLPLKTLVDQNSFIITQWFCPHNNMVIYI